MQKKQKEIESVKESNRNLEFNGGEKEGIFLFHGTSVCCERQNLMGTDSQKRDYVSGWYGLVHSMIRFRGDGANQIVGRRSHEDTIFR